MISAATAEKKAKMVLSSEKLPHFEEKQSPAFSKRLQALRWLIFMKKETIKSSFYVPFFLAVSLSPPTLWAQAKRRNISIQIQISRMWNISLFLNPHRWWKKWKMFSPSLNMLCWIGKYSSMCCFVRIFPWTDIDSKLERVKLSASAWKLCFQNQN